MYENQDIFIDLSIYNLLKASALIRATSAARSILVPKVAPRLPSEVESKFMREMTKAPLPQGFVAKLLAAVTGSVYTPIDFVTMKRDDPRHPTYGYIKAAHGTAGPGNVDQYPIEYYVKPMIEMYLAGWGMSAYHFYYMDMQARDQAACLFNSINAVCGGDLKYFGTADPVFDLEDNTSVTYKSITDTNIPIDTRIANAKFFLGSVFKLALDTSDQLWSNKLGRTVITRIYSGPWFWNILMQLLMMTNKAGDPYWPEHQKIFDYYNKRLTIGAWYSGDHLPFIPAANQKMLMTNQVALQYGSYGVPPWVGYTIGGGTPLDGNLFLGSHDEYYKFIGLPKPVTPPPPPPTSGRSLEQVDAALAKVEETFSKVKDAWA